MSTPYFPALRAVCAPMGARARQASRAADRLDGLAALFSGYFGDLLAPASSGPGSRRRRFPRVDVFWAFLSQILHRGDSCRHALRRLQALATSRGEDPGGDDTSPYCQARAALSLVWLKSLFEALGRRFLPAAPQTPTWCGRTARLIDGTCFSMPDTPANRCVYDQAGCQKPGCGFPVGKFVGLFCLHTGRLVSFAYRTWKTHELMLARGLLPALQRGEVLVADRGFCGYEFLAQLQERGVDFVFRLHSSRRVGRKAGTDWSDTIARPPRKPWIEREVWQALPATLAVRLVRFRVQRPGYRTHTVVLVTSLTDTALFPADALATLYEQRWQIELHYRQIKISLGLDVLRGLTPAIIERELWMHAIAYNLVRALMLESSVAAGRTLRSLSFMGALALIEAWAPLLAGSPRRRRGLRSQLLRCLAGDPVPFRPGRVEPRVVKRRPKNYRLLTRPRAVLRAELFCNS